ncbi:MULTISPECIES: UDP-2,3-diacylglucosamine diphosphatase [unclassified Arsenophonus]|uniref:UDP-2,3-diacylglucosamine diphosphatase n=1 Tax=unclassified Arsenophonus TaxID=2627083 RepID=UPI002856C7EB|nr:UDP-2,3-diacylglucosamine diphosphatase [Arsenophonus sp.]MDR5609925.1 UDP-2,3-diacylglucosamine diphosphatase [Arsenophonus sp.]MDR5613758.1 UDP-2,3-diacylglucosamine diphosphatase [Arsenophonus sp.]
MAILFIADLHLSEKEPAITAGFLHFLRGQASQAKALYILGDFFDYWIGDDDPSLLHEAIAQELKELQSKGVPCYFIHGNRDFLLGKKFAKESGMILLPAEKVLTLHGHNILILHGDTLCTDDISYQRYRKRVYNRWLQRLFLALPLSTRHRIAERMRKNSQSATRLKPEYITDVNEQTVIEKFRKYQVDWMIHGHTHRPAIHEINVNGKILHRAVLGAWDQNGSVIKITPKTIELLHFPFY